MSRPQGRKRKAVGQEPQNIKRWRNHIATYTQGLTSRDTLESASGEKTVPKAKTTLSRKEKRKEVRKLNKMRRHAFSQHTKVPGMDALEKEREEKEKLREARKKKMEKRKRQRENKRARLAAEKEEADKQTQVERQAIEQDEKAIKQLEKQMKMNKRKSKNLPQSFINDGLDFILDAVDGQKLKGLTENEDAVDELSGPLLDSGSEDNDSDDYEEVEGNMDSEEEDEESSDEERLVPEVEGESTDVKGILKNVTKTKEEKKVHFGSAEEDSDDEEVEVKAPANKKDLLSFVKQSLAEVKMEKRAATKTKAGDEDIDSEDGDDDMESADDLDENDQEGSGNEESEEDDDGSDEDDAEGEAPEDDSEDEKEGESEEEDSESGEMVEAKVDEPKEPEYKEDIYGRLRDKDGNIVTLSKGPATTGAYVPPGKRQQMATTSDAKKKLELEKMKKQIKGLVNRLSEGNVQSISSQIEGMFQLHSRAELSEVLAETVCEACISVSLIPDRLISEQMLLIAMVHMNIGSEVGALFLQDVVERFDRLHKQGGNYGEGKELDNILVMLSNMYNFKMFQSVLIYDILKLLVETFEERDIELLLVMLRNVGFSLRKDDPAALKDIIIKIQEKASATDTSRFNDESRVKFMLEVLMAIKNNNMRKIPNFDPTHVEHLRKILRNHCRGSSLLDEQLNITLRDLLDADRKGRWWLVGSAWTGRNINEEDEAGTATPRVSAGGYSDKILELARKQRMNTDVRRNIFCIIMTCEDFVDSFEKLLKLNLKNQQEREIIHVLMDVCLQEKAVNPFYAVLVQKFCEFHRRFQMTVQFNFWDRMKILDEMSTQSIKNLASFMTHLIVTKAMSLSVFKTVEFSELSKQKILLIRLILKALLLNHPEHILIGVFGRVAPFPKLAALREALRVFMRHFLLRKLKGKDAGELEPRIELAEQALTAAEKTSRL